VHGGPDYSSPVLINAEVVTRLERYVPLAPLHQPHNLAPIRSILTNLPQLPQVACFDTAFHRDHAAVADHFAIPQYLYAEGVRRPRPPRGASLSLILATAPPCARRIAPLSGRHFPWLRPDRARLSNCVQGQHD